jgi:hypothetical protein
MYCRNCGKNVDPRAVGCPACGLPPMAERKFRHNCGAATDPRQAICVKCGIALAGPTAAESRSAVAWALVPPAALAKRDDCAHEAEHRRHERAHVGPHFVGEGVLEGVFEIREDARLVEELGRLEAGESSQRWTGSSSSRARRTT